MLPRLKPNKRCREESDLVGDFVLHHSKPHPNTEEAIPMKKVAQVMLTKNISVIQLRLKTKIIILPSEPFFHYSTRIFCEMTPEKLLLTD